jgi:hypothetical protein
MGFKKCLIPCIYHSSVVRKNFSPFMGKLQIKKKSPICAFFHRLWFWCYILKVIAKHRSSRFSPMIIFEFYSLAFIFVIHIELSFEMGIRKVFIEFLVIPTSFVEKAIHSPLTFLCSFVKDHLNIFACIHSWATCFSSDLLSIFCQFHIFLIAVWSLEIE